MTASQREFADRMKNVRKLMKDNHLEALITTLPADMRYLSNYVPIIDEGMMVIAEGINTTIFIEEKDDLVRARDITSSLGIDVSGATEFGRDIANLLKGNVEKGKVGVVGWSKFPTPSYLSLKEMLPGLALEDMPAIIQGIRNVKSPSEIKLMESAAKITDMGMKAATEALRAGKNEFGIAAAGEAAIREAGAELSFPSNIGSGDRTLLMSGLPSTKKPRKGDLVLMDFGAKYDGYHGDLTRTRGFGKVGERQKELFDVVREMQKKAIQAVRPGARAFEIHEAAKAVAREAGYDKYIMHMTGHSLGLGLHERPFLETEKTELVSGMTTTIEPGLYVPKIGGIRIEDMVLVTEAGRRVLTSSNRDL